VTIAEMDRLDALLDRLRTVQADVFEREFRPFFHRLDTLGGDRFDVERYEETTTAFERLRAEHRQLTTAIMEADRARHVSTALHRGRRACE